MNMETYHIIPLIKAFLRLYIYLRFKWELFAMAFKAILYHLNTICKSSLTCQVSITEVPVCCGLEVKCPHNSRACTLDSAF